MRASRRLSRGFTLLEITVVVIILTILMTVAIPKIGKPGAITLHPQAQALADILRRAQSTAQVRGRFMRVQVAPTGANGQVAMSCFTFGSLPTCDTTTNTTLSFAQDVSVAGSTIYFNTLGVPVNSNGTALAVDTAYTASFTSGSTTKTFTVTVAALTGRVSISP